MSTQETVRLIMSIWKEFAKLYGKKLGDERVVFGNELAEWPRFLRANLERID